MRAVLFATAGVGLLLGPLVVATATSSAVSGYRYDASIQSYDVAVKTVVAHISEGSLARAGNGLAEGQEAIATAGRPLSAHFEKSVATNSARAESIVSESRTYVDLTRGASIRNVGTNATHTEFAETLAQNGWASRVSSDGAVQIFQKDGAKYVLQSKNSSGYPGWTADFTPAGSARHALEIRLGYVP